MRRCKRCNELKDYILVSPKDGKASYYIDSNQKKWKGRVCPDCYVKQHREYQQSRSEAKPTGQIYCPICGTVFEQKIYTQLYCSEKCRVKANQK